MATTLESTPLKTSSACPRKQLCVAFGKLAASAKSRNLSGEVKAGKLLRHLNRMSTNNSVSCGVGRLARPEYAI